MHPTQLGPFRKTVITAITLAFAGTLLIYTGQANLDLLRSLYPNPQFYMFGLLALEGGTIYWTGYYLLHTSGTHKGLAIFALAIDALLAGTGFFYEMERMTNQVGVIQLPPVIVVVAGAVLFNVAMALITHLLPSGPFIAAASRYAAAAAAEAEEADYGAGYEPRTLPQTASTPEKIRPGMIANATASIIASAADVKDLASEKIAQKRAARRKASEPPITVSAEAAEEPEKN